jgi:hypothetical protein
LQMTRIRHRKVYSSAKHVNNAMISASSQSTSSVESDRPCDFAPTPFDVVALRHSTLDTRICHGRPIGRRISGSFTSVLGAAALRPIVKVNAADALTVWRLHQGKSRGVV